MNIVYLGAPITVNLSVGQTIAVNTNGTVTVECVSGLGLTDGATIGSIHGSATYGPFSAVGVARITATVRDGAYEVSDGQPIPIDTVLASSGKTVLDDASRAALLVSGVGGLPTIYCFGSSSTARNQTGNSKNNWGYITRFLRKCGGAVRYLGSSGVSGEDSIDQLARLPAVIAALTEKPKFFVLQIGGNDIQTATALSTVLSNITTMFSLVQSAGMIPVLYTPPPKSTYTASEIIRFGAICEHMRWLFRKTPNSRLADVARFTLDTTTTTYTVISGLQAADNTHLNARGAENAAMALYEALANDVASMKYSAAIPVVSQYDATNNPYGSLVANPFLTGTTGTGGAWVTAGSVPTGFTVTRSAGTGTVAISTVARTDRPGNWTRFTFAMQAGDTFSITSRPSVSLTTESLYGIAEARADRSAASGNVSRLGFRLRDNSATTTIWDGSAAGSGAENYEPTTAIADEWYETVPNSFANFGFGYWTADLAFNGSGTFILDVGCMDIRIARN